MFMTSHYQIDFVSVEELFESFLRSRVDSCRTKIPRSTENRSFSSVKYFDYRARGRITYCIPTEIQGVTLRLTAAKSAANQLTCLRVEKYYYWRLNQINDGTYCSGNAPKGPELSLPEPLGSLGPMIPFPN